MGNQDLETRPTEVPLEKKATYSVISYPGRELPDSYRGMILAKWLRTLRFGNDLFKLIDSNAYFSNYQIYIKKLMDRQSCIVRLAVLTEAPDVCLGFSVSEPDVLHFCWVHKDNRKIGVGRALTSFPFSVITHLTTKGMSLWSRYFPSVKFNPFF